MLFIPLEHLVNAETSGVDIVPGGSNCCLNFGLWFSIAMNRETHKASAVMDILYIFIWLPSIKTQNYCCWTKKTSIIFFCSGPIDA